MKIYSKEKRYKYKEEFQASGLGRAAAGRLLYVKFYFAVGIFGKKRIY